MSEKSQQIHDMIQMFDMAGHPELVTSRLLDILDAINRRIDDLESRQSYTANVASCLANGIQPD